jgi:hypothetical protein
MTTHRGAGLVLATLALAACGGGRGPVEINPQDQQVAGRWNALVATPSGLAGAIQVRGRGWMAPSGKEGETRAEVRISNAAPGGVHPWHVHRGRCGADQGIFGPPNAYEPLKVDGDGNASSTALIPLPAPTTGEYYVNVHASRTNMGTIVACGNLASPIR